jgi:hypothetical protein
VRYSPLLAHLLADTQRINGSSRRRDFDPATTRRPIFRLLERMRAGKQVPPSRCQFNGRAKLGAHRAQLGATAYDEDDDGVPVAQSVNALNRWWSASFALGIRPPARILVAC